MINLNDLGRTLISIDFDPLARKVLDKTSAHAFTRLLRPIWNNSRILSISAKDFYDEDLAASMMALVVDKCSSEFVAEVKILCFTHPPYAFEQVLLMKDIEQFSAGGDYKAFPMVVCFPCFRYEFSGAESPALIDEIRHKFVATLDWRRKPQPRAYLCFDNKNTRSYSKGFRLSPIERINLQLSKLPVGEDSYVEIKNIQEKVVRMTRLSPTEFKMKMGSGEMTVRLGREKDWVHSFLTSGPTELS